MKQYQTIEQCLEENGEHAWYNAENKFGLCLVYHQDGHCSWNDYVKKCYHCPATLAYRQTQMAISEWVDETPKAQRINKDLQDGINSMPNVSLGRIKA